MERTGDGQRISRSAAMDPFVSNAHDFFNCQLFCGNQSGGLSSVINSNKVLIVMVCHLGLSFHHGGDKQNTR